MPNKASLKEILAQKRAAKGKTFPSAQKSPESEVPEKPFKEKQNEQPAENPTERSTEEGNSDTSVQDSLSALRELGKQEDEKSQSAREDFKQILDFEIENPDFSAQDFIDASVGLQTAMEENSSEDLGIHCKQILQNLRQYEELTYILKPEQIGAVVNGLIKYSGVVVSTSAKKNKSAKDIQKELELASGGGDISDLL